jgi:hypothetical protein
VVKLYNNNGVGVVKIAEDGMGFIVGIMCIAMIVVFLFHTLDSAGQEVMLIRDMVFSIYQNNTCTVAKETIN